MEIIAYFKSSIRKKANVDDYKFEHIYVLVNDNNTYKIKHIVGNYKIPDDPENIVYDIKTNSPLLTFIDKAFDNFRRFEDVFLSNDRRVKCMELGLRRFNNVVGNDVIDMISTQLGANMSKSELVYIDTMSSQLGVDINESDLSVLYGKTIISQNNKLTTGNSICTINNRDNALYRLLKLSKDYVAEHPDEIVWLTSKYYVKYIDIKTISDWQHWETSNIFVEYI